MKKKNWYLHFTYVDNFGMQHNMKYKMPKDFQKSVAGVFDTPAPKLKFEED